MACEETSKTILPLILKIVAAYESKRNQMQRTPMFTDARAIYLPFGGVYM